MSIFFSRFNTDYTEILSIIITNPSDKDANVHVAPPYANFTDFDVTIGAGTSKEVPITPADIQTDYMDVNNWNVGYIENKIITVDSNTPILLVASNTHSDLDNGDKYVIYPICQLGKEYHVIADEAQTFWMELMSTNIFTVIATEDATTVTIPWITNVSGVVINKGQQYTFADYYSVTNIVVSADKPVAVLSGAICGFGYWNPDYCNHEAVMLYPTDNWDTTIPYFKFRPSDEGEMMVLIKENGTDLSADGKVIFSGLTEYNYVIANITQGIYFTANKPIYGVAIGSENSRGEGSPFFVHLPSPKNFITGSITFATGLSDIETKLVHFVRVVTDIASIGSITVDNYTPNGLLYIRMGRSTYYFRDVLVQTGQHTVSAPDGVEFRAEDAPKERKALP
ncbi:hypothetical protein WR25_07839 [Diploscapter pachys]|uniref:IgGFc-binding protein N-terminal domain-containing protein n=1 Tax=Diploscapter pachys TaxID=2018661 RepID=A0A2A2JF20_9BILA|nr:hypothetical protein WR25_07839 [Diploscapter pachys]